MRANFDKSKVSDILWQILIGVDIFLFPCLGACIKFSYKIAALVFLFFAVIVTAGWIIFAEHHGKIYATDSRVIIAHMIFGKKIGKRVIGYASIEYANCIVDTYGTKYGDIVYTMIFTIKKKDGSEIGFKKRLDIKKNFPVVAPERY
ncbi:MAG: hypothetical protein K2H23_08170, partial [Oscillospiraceae bacterium]|nr:hypothetical protein [Oscillospiraceae bacterium]